MALCCRTHDCGKLSSKKTRTKQQFTVFLLPFKWEFLHRHHLAICYVIHYIHQGSIFWNFTISLFLIWLIHMKINLQNSWFGRMFWNILSAALHPGVSSRSLPAPFNFYQHKNKHDLFFLIHWDFFPAAIVY